MTLKEKFRQWFINDEEDEHFEGMVELVSIEHEKIADEFAIGFAEWMAAEYWLNSSGKYKQGQTTKELLEIYKTQKGL